MGCSKRNFKREAYSDTGIPQENKEKFQINNLPEHLTELEKKNNKQSPKSEEGRIY